MTARRLAAPAALAAVGVLGAARAGWGQPVVVERPRTFVVGAPRGGARTDRVDGARSGRSPVRLPASPLRSEWRTPLGTLVEHAPVVDEHGTTIVVGKRGEVIAIARDGSEQWHVATGAGQPGPPALLSDGTVVFVDAAGEAVAVRRGAVSWRRRFGRTDGARPAPLPLEDGGVVVATIQEIAVLDADGVERSRAALPEPTVLPLVAARGQVIVVSMSGTVWSWGLGIAEPSRVGSFGSPVDSGAALADDHTLVGVNAGQLHVTSVDLSRGEAKTLAVAPAGQWLGPPAMLGSSAFVGLLTPTSELALTLDADGKEIARTLLTLHPPGLTPDAGAAPLHPLHTPPLVDAAGTMAFATAEGGIGVVHGETVELLGEACEPPAGIAGRDAPAVVALAPLEPGAMVAVCHAGAVLAIAERAARGANR
jgi:hypothetical protein